MQSAMLTTAYLPGGNQVARVVFKKLVVGTISGIPDGPRDLGTKCLVIQSERTLGIYLFGFYLQFGA